MPFIYPEQLPLETLESVHDEYKHFKEFYPLVDSLVEGGWRLQKEVGKYLAQKPDEDTKTYAYRKSLFTSTPILTETLNQLVNKFSTAVHTVLGLPSKGRAGKFWDSFRENVDTARTSEKQLLRDAFERLIKYRRVFCVVEKEDGEVANRRQEENLRPYLLLLDPRTVVNWGTSEVGTLEWVKLRTLTEDRSPLSSKPTLRGAWTMYDDTYIARYEATLTIDSDGNLTVADSTGRPAQRQEAQLVTLVEHGRNRLPVVMAELPTTLWVTNQAILLTLEHLRVSNNLTYIAVVAGTIQRLYKPLKESAEEDFDIEALQKQFGTTKVIVGESFSFNETTGSAIKTVSEHLKDIEVRIKDLIFSNSVTADPNRSNMQESGVAKSLDFVNQESALRAYGQILIRWLEESYRLVAEAYGEPAEPSVISAHGLTEFALDSVDQKIARMQMLEVLRTPVSKSARKMLMKELCKALLPNASAIEYREFSDEIDADFGDDEGKDGMDLAFEEVIELYGAKMISLESALDLVGLNPQKILPLLEAQREKDAEEDLQKRRNVALAYKLLGLMPPNTASSPASAQAPA